MLLIILSIFTRVSDEIFYVLQGATIAFRPEEQQSGPFLQDLSARVAKNGENM